ncbi:MAG: exo-alpha-sialidase [Planctomycetaceae bacterium]
MKTLRLVPAYLVILMTLTVAEGDDARTVTLDAGTRQRCLEVLRAGLRSSEFWPSIHAAEGLTLGGYGQEVIEFLKPKLATEKDDQHRCGIARELVRAGDRSYTDMMLQILAGDAPHGHTHAAESLYKVIEIGDGVAMRKGFWQDDDIRWKLMAAAALARCGNPEAKSFLRDSLQSEDLEVMKIAAWVLGVIGDASDIPRLKQQLPRCEEVVVKSYVQNALALLGDRDGLNSLALNLTHSDPDVRTYAANFAGDARAVNVAETLKQMLNDSHPDAAYRAAQSLFVLATPVPPSEHEDVSKIIYPATQKNPRYTEGSIVALRNGSLLCAVTEFHDSDSDFAKAHIIGRTSSDGGRTWNESRVLQENTGGLNVMSVTLRRLRNGSIAMFYLQKNSLNDLQLLVRFSEDEAASFGPSVRITGDEGYHVVNNDRVTQLSSGRLLAPAASTADVEKVDHFVSHCYFSDDHGATWKNGSGHVDADKRGAMEPEVIELNDGRIMMIIRTQLGFIGKSYSTDGGDTWSPMTSLGVKAPEAPATLRRIPATGDLLLIWNNTFTAGVGHGGLRTPLTTAVSKDEGETWQVVDNLRSQSRSNIFVYQPDIHRKSGRHELLGKRRDSKPALPFPIIASWLVLSVDRTSI